MIADPNIACAILVNLSMVCSSPDSACSLFVYPYDRDTIVRRNGTLFGEMPGISNVNVYRRVNHELPTTKKGEITFPFGDVAFTRPLQQNICFNICLYNLKSG